MPNKAEKCYGQRNISPARCQESEPTFNRCSLHRSDFLNRPDIVFTFPKVRSTCIRKRESGRLHTRRKTSPFASSIVPIRKKGPIRHTINETSTQNREPQTHIVREDLSADVLLAPFQELPFWPLLLRFERVQSSLKKVHSGGVLSTTTGAVAAHWSFRSHTSLKRVKAVVVVVMRRSRLACASARRKRI